jgi:hypothetical protein
MIVRSELELKAININEILVCTAVRVHVLITRLYFQMTTKCCSTVIVS